MQDQSRSLEALIEPTLIRMGYALWGCEYHGRGKRPLLRVYIEGPDGVTLDDCARASHQLSGLLDVEDPVQGAYTLEVSSPGLDRPLLRPEHFERCIGQAVTVRLHRPVEGRRNFSGVLAGLNDGRILIEENGAEYVLPLADVQRAKLVPEL